MNDKKNNFNMNLKSSEFRIGNLLQDANGRLLKVSDLNDGIQGIAFKKLERKFKTMLPVSEIPLSEEWLVRFGLELNTYKDGDGEEYYEFSIGDFKVYNSAYYSEFHFDFGDNDSMEVLTIHHLQNLYFAITKQELAFNQTKSA